MKNIKFRVASFRSDWQLSPYAGANLTGDETVTNPEKGMVIIMKAKKILRSASITCVQAVTLWGVGWLFTLGINVLMSWLQL